MRLPYFAFINPHISLAIDSNSFILKHPFRVSRIAAKDKSIKAFYFKENNCYTEEQVEKLGEFHTVLFN